MSLEFNKISIVVPAYNEEEVIGSLIKAVKDAKLGDYELIIVNDGSNDNTEVIIKKEAKKDKRIRLISHAHNQGLGAALRTGFAAAKKEIIVTMDSDLTHHPSFILNLLGCMEKKGCDVCIASRYVKGGGMRNVPMWRVALSKVANVFFSIIFHIKAKDITSGFKAYKAKKIKSVRITRTDFASQLEIMAKLARMKASFCEIPYILETRKKGVSKFKPAMYLKYLGVLKDLI